MRPIMCRILHLLTIVLLLTSCAYERATRDKVDLFARCELFTDGNEGDCLNGGYSGLEEVINRYFRIYNENDIRRGPNDEIYRFTWYNVDGMVRCVRMSVQENGSGDVVIKASPMNVVRKRCPMYLEMNRTVSAEEVMKFKNLLLSSGFWEMPRITRAKVRDVSSQFWLMEARNNDRYQYVFRIDLDEGKLRQALLYFEKIGLSWHSCQQPVPPTPE